MCGCVCLSVCLRINRAQARRYVVQSASEMRPEVLRDSGDIVANRCPFEGGVSHSIEANLEHMAACHGFFVPYIADLAMVSELLEYLVRKVVSLLPLCVWVSECVCVCLRVCKSGVSALLAGASPLGRS